MEDQPPPTDSVLSLRKSVSISSTSSASSIASTGALPPKKRRLCSIEGVEAPAQDISTFATESAVSKQTVHTSTVSVASDETSCAPNTVETMLQNNVVHTIIRNNAEFVASVLRERDEIERLNVAKSLLLKAFLEASAKL